MNLIWLIPLFPLLGFLITGIGSKRIPVSISGWLASAMVLLSFIFSLIAFLKISGGVTSETITLFNWINSGGLNISFGLLLDPLSAVMILIITGVGFLIHIYSIGYMNNDEGFPRFFAYMNLFVFFMLILVLAGNYAVMFVGWEGVGLCSYLLIGFWNTDNKNNDAAKKAFIMNRVGDLGFLIGIFLIFTTFGSLDYSTVFAKAALLAPGSLMITTITLLLFAGATGKSAQIPLLTWLPDAMAGPTPVSALIHAATMVTAGIYMVARSNILYLLSPVSMLVITIVGLATALLAATIALFQNDIKKVLAYSTISQLGLMFLGLGVGAFSAAMFHLITHAFFKALLFLAAGSIIHSLHGEQDIRKMGGLRKKLPYTLLIFLTGALAISGIPPFSGFYSKDEILLAAFSTNPVLWIAGIIVSVMTAFYVFRLFWLTFTGTYRGSNETFEKVHEAPSVMLWPLIILAVFSALGAIPVIAGTGGNSLDKFLEPVFKVPEVISHNGTDMEHGKWILISVTLAFILISIAVSYLLFFKRKRVPEIENSDRNLVEKTIYNKFYIDEFYEVLITRQLKSLSSFLHNKTDKKFFDWLVESTGRFIMFTGDKIRLIQTGNVGFYLFGMVICIIIVLLFNLLK